MLHYFLNFAACALRTPVTLDTSLHFSNKISLKKIVYIQRDRKKQKESIKIKMFIKLEDLCHQKPMNYEHFFGTKV